MQPTLCRFDLEQACKSGRGLSPAQAEAVWNLVEDRLGEILEANSAADEAERELDAARDELHDAGVEVAKLRKIVAALPEDLVEATAKLLKLESELNQARRAIAELRQNRPYRYVRQQRSKSNGLAHWALWERERGGRAIRVGTAYTEAEVKRFLSHGVESMDGAA